MYAPMDKFDRFQLLHRLFLSHRNPIPIANLAERLECSEKTVKRAIDGMCDFLDAPIEYDRQRNGWHYTKEGEKYELPGLWLTSGELQSLALLIHLTDHIGQGILRDELGVIDNSIEKLLKTRGIERSAFDRHIKVLPLTSRCMADRTFAATCEALLTKKRLDIAYCDYHERKTDRQISPQTLVYYRENWYLDAWCHLRSDLRTFSVARIERISIEKAKSKIVPQRQLHDYFSKGYGIFAGKAKHRAKLRFGPQIAREIAMQQWHPNQKAEWDGKDYLLTIPYSEDTELLKDIMAHSPYVEVMEPNTLRRAVAERIAETAAFYRDDKRNKTR